MDWASFLYNLFIFPIEIIYQVIFRLSEKYISNPVISILALSVIVNILVLPLYNRADILAKKQSDAEKLISDRKKLISKTFKGDERLMMLKAYYREMHYNPYASLLGSVPLLLQIPFFIAAYHFLSNLQYLRGVSFGPISDLASPDGLLWGVNLLPILMTLINIISLLFYRRSHPEGKLLQPLVLAGLFLVLLYTSPSGLVYYWTLNNLFSLLKNIVYLLLPRLKSSSKKHSGSVDKPVNMKGVHAVFIFSALFFALNTGMRYTSNLLKGCYQDFVNLVYYTDPVMLIWNGFVIACGFFIVWCSVYYLLFSDRNRRRMSCIMFALCAASLSSGIMPSQFLGQMSSVFNIRFHIIVMPEPYGTQESVSSGADGVIIPAVPVSSIVAALKAQSRAVGYLIGNNAFVFEKVPDRMVHGALGIRRHQVLYIVLISFIKLSSLFDHERIGTYVLNALIKDSLKIFQYTFRVLPRDTRYEVRGNVRKTGFKSSIECRQCPFGIMQPPERF